MDDILVPEILAVVAVAAAFLLLVVLSVRIMRWAIVRRHSEPFDG